MPTEAELKQQATALLEAFRKEISTGYIYNPKERDFGRQILDAEPRLQMYVIFATLNPKNPDYRLNELQNALFARSSGHTERGCSALFGAADHY